MLMRNKCPSIKTDSSTTDTLDYHSPELED